MVSEVLNHMHPGGTDPAAPVPAGAAAIAKSLKRKRKTAALVLKYAAPEATNPALRALLRTAGDDGEAMWDLYQATEIGAQAESSAETIKTEMRNASILGTVGFMRGSVSAFAQWLYMQNGRIEPITARLNGHELSVIMLQALSKTGAAGIATDALKEFNAPVGSRLYIVGAPAIAAQDRDIDQIVTIAPEST